MTQFETIAIKDIFVPERLRAVEEEHALVIAQSIVEHGLINPVSVRRTPAQKGGKFTLIAGAHRLRAFEINDDDAIDALIFEADQAEGQLLEITENLFRNELSVIDRAVFVQSYRDIWEAKHGKIDPTNNLKKGGNSPKGQLGPSGGNRANLAQLISDEAEQSTFGAHVADRMGLSVRSYKRLNQIAQNLNPNLRAKLRGTPVADNQSMLLKLAKMGPSKQAEISAGLQFNPDLQLVLKAAEPVKPKPSAQQVFFDRLVDTWRRTDAKTKARFLEHLRETGAIAK